jgi:hypothetical protein
VRVELRGLLDERLPHSCSTVIKVRVKGILRGSGVCVLKPHDGDKGEWVNIEEYRVVQ